MYYCPILLQCCFICRHPEVSHRTSPIHVLHYLFKAYRQASQKPIFIKHSTFPKEFYLKRLAFMWGKSQLFWTWCFYVLYWFMKPQKLDVLSLNGEHLYLYNLMITGRWPLYSHCMWPVLDHPKQFTRMLPFFLNSH